jgi:hypothetical protein
VLNGFNHTQNGYKTTRKVSRWKQKAAKAYNLTLAQLQGHIGPGMWGCSRCLKKSICESCYGNYVPNSASASSSPTNNKRKSADAAFANNNKNRKMPAVRHSLTGAIRSNIPCRHFYGFPGVKNHDLASSNDEGCAAASPTNTPADAVFANNKKKRKLPASAVRM